MNDHEILHQSTRSLYSDHNHKMTSKTNFDEQNGNDALRQSTFDSPASENYPQVSNCEELSFRYVITMRCRLQLQLSQHWHKYLL